MSRPHYNIYYSATVIDGPTVYISGGMSSLSEWLTADL